MKAQIHNKPFFDRLFRATTVLVIGSALTLPANVALFGQTATPTPAPAAAPIAEGTPAPAPQEDVKIPNDQLDALVAPIALYPDNLLAQVLVASTYPLEIVQLHQWLLKNKDVQKDQKKLAEKVAKESWDPSIQAMAPLPDVVKWLADDVQWTTDLGNAFLAQQKDVMAAVQRMRSKAQDKGTLKSTEQASVETKTVEGQSVIVIEQSNPQVVYVPQYDPVVVYGAAAYPYPPIYYPPYYGAGYAWGAAAIGFGVGIAIGAAWGGGWGWGCGWGGGDVDINMNNNFNRNTNINGGNRNNIGNGNRPTQNGKWQHNPSHRGGTPYGDRKTASQFGGTARNDSLGNRQKAAQRDIGRNNGNLGSTRGDIGNRGGVGGGAGGRGGLDNAGGLTSRNNAPANNGGFGTGGNRGGSNSMGSRDLGSNRSSGGFGGGSGSSSWGGARSSSSRGSSSWGGSRGGGSFGGGGMSRGGGRGGGGGRRR